MDLGKNFFLNNCVVYSMSSSIQNLVGGDYHHGLYHKYLEDITNPGHEIFNRVILTITDNCWL